MKLQTLQELVEQVFGTSFLVPQKIFTLSSFCHRFICQPLQGNQDIDPNIPVSSENDDATLSILVENSGRINYKLPNNAYMGLHKEGLF